MYFHLDIRSFYSSSRIDNLREKASNDHMKETQSTLASLGLSTPLLDGGQRLLMACHTTKKLSFFLPNAVHKCLSGAS